MPKKISVCIQEGEKPAMELPEPVTRSLEAFVGEVQLVFSERLISVVLYGSAADGRLRKTSYVNVLVVIGSYTSDDAALLTPILTFASVAIDLLVWPSKRQSDITRVTNYSTLQKSRYNILGWRSLVGCF